MLPNKAGGRWGGGQGEARAQRGVGLVAHQSRSSQLSSAVAEAASRCLSSEGLLGSCCTLGNGIRHCVCTLSMQRNGQVQIVRKQVFIHSLVFVELLFL